MTSWTTRMLARTSQQAQPRGIWRSWRTAVGLAAVAAGGVITAGAFLPWVETFAGLIQISGVAGGNGRILAAAGIVIAAAGIWQLFGGGKPSRWAIGLGGFAALGFSGYLLIQLTATMSTLGGDAMVIARGGPGLWVCTAGSLAAFATLFLPSSSQVTLRSPHTRGAWLVWAADLESAGARRGLQIALGLLWLADAALQYQPSMFGPSMVTRVLAPSAMGNPGVIAGSAMSADQVIAHNPVAWNAAFATLQLALGLCLLWRRAARAALAGTIVWALGVWWLGEGLGGLFTGTASPLTGAPGAALLYVLAAVLVWPAASSSRPGTAPATTPPTHSGSRAGLIPTRPARTAGWSVAAASPLGNRWSRLAWLILWAGFAYLVLTPASRATHALGNAIAAMADAEPGWLASVDHATAQVARTHATLISVLLAAAFALIAAGILLPSTRRPALIMAAGGALVIWVVGENFGAILTGYGTDPSTGPLLILLVAAYWPLRQPAAGTAETAPAPRPAAHRTAVEPAHG